MAVATIAAPADPVHVTGLIDEAGLSTIRETGEATVDLAGRAFCIRRQFLDDVAEQRLLGEVAALDAAVLVMHSPVDNLVDIDHARRIYEAARHPKSFVSLDGADHLLTNRDDSAFVARLLATWAVRYLPRTDPVPDTPSVEGPHTDEGDVVVEESGIGEFAQRIVTGRHALVADEPIGIGDDTGPSPYDLLLAGLGACTSMTLRMHASRKNFPLDHVRVRLRHERTHSDDCAEPATAPCRIEVIHRTIELRGDLDDAQRVKLAEIADKCPVHRTLTSDLRVRTTLV